MSEGETLSDHAAAASQKALEMANIQASELDLILLATSSPDDLFGSACQVQSVLGASRAVAFDLTAACSGFVVGMVTAAQYIRTGAYRNVLIIGADALSRYVDWRDRGAGLWDTLLVDLQTLAKSCPHDKSECLPQERASCLVTAAAQ